MTVLFKTEENIARRVG